MDPSPDAPPPSDASDACSEEASPWSFPPEVFLALAAFLGPQSRALLELSLASREMHHLLLPTLLRRVVVPDPPSPGSVDAFLAGTGAGFAPDRLRLVRHLALPPSWDSGGPVLRRCRSLTRLDCEAASAEDLVLLQELAPPSLLHLSLRIRGEPYVPPLFALDLPHLLHLSYRGPIHARIEAAALALPALETIDTHYDQPLDQLAEAGDDVYPDFLAKIRTLTFRKPDLLEALARRPEFRPRAVVQEPGQRPAEPARSTHEMRILAAAREVPSVREVEMNTLSSTALCAWYDPKLESVKVRRARLDISPAFFETRAKELAEVNPKLALDAPPSAGEPVVEMAVDTDAPHPDGPEARDAELAFWRRMGGVRVVIAPQAGGQGA